MNDEQLESLLHRAAESEMKPREPSSQLTAKVLDTVAGRQSRGRRTLLVSTVAGAYVAGMLTMWFCLPLKDAEATDPDQQQIASQTTSGDEPMQTPPQVQETVAMEAPQLHLDEPNSDAVVVVETLLFPERSVYQLFRELGDASHARGDVSSSVLYYRMALDSATSQELQTDSHSDNLLLLSLKQDRIASIQVTTHGESL